MALLLALPLGAPARAFADVRGTDEILGASVEARGLPAVACPNVTASFALVMDDEGTVLFSRGALERSHIASITKIMTAIVALDSGVPLDSTVTVSQEAASVGESSASLWAGDTLTLEAALAGLMIPSGNDAAIAIAETLGEGMKTDDSQTANEAFVAAMNAKAAELGMTETLFSNPHGLDIGAYDNEMYSCARDVALMSAYAMGNETFRSIVSKESARSPSRAPTASPRSSTFSPPIVCSAPTRAPAASRPATPRRRAIPSLARATAATAFCTPSCWARPPRTRASRTPRRCSTGSTTTA